MTDNEYLYLFLDESGNLDFSPSGTRYFVLTCVSVTRPFPWEGALDRLKYDCLEYGLEIQRFHCAADNAHVRRKVFDIINGSLSHIHIDSLIVEKCKTGPALTVENRFYPEMLGYLLRYVLSGVSAEKSHEVIVITDTIPLKRKRRAIEKAVKGTLSEMLPSGQGYRIMHHDSRSHDGLQIADYCCWATYRKYEIGDSTWYDRIRGGVRSEFDIFRTGKTYYY